MPKKKEEMEIEDAMKKVTEEQKGEPMPPADEKQKQIEELTDMLQRVQAEYINYKNRTEKEKVHCQEYANADLLKKLLPVLDSFELALKNTADPDKFKKGMEMVYAQLADVMKHEGVSEIKAHGKFDPYKHDVLLKVDSDKEEDSILEELQKGYELKGKVLRHTKVKISNGVKKENKEEHKKGE